MPQVRENKLPPQGLYITEMFITKSGMKKL